MMMGARSAEDQHQADAAMRGYRYKHGDRPLEGYTIQRAAGRGAFGEVYFAVSDSGREVALKVVQAYEQVELRGIGQCMNLKSPHLVSVFDVRDGEHGQPIVIMEYVAGPSLRDLLDEAPSGLGTQKAAFFLREIGKGLTYLHDCGIVHRDLKPANIFYENGYVKIGDYGLSKAISASHRSAQTVTVGTLHYMAPEVGNGCYDRSVDIYALGALLYEMLTGQPPFFGVSPAEVLMKHITAPVKVDGIEEPFATVIRRALAKDPAQRYQSVQEMVEGIFGAEHVRQSVSSFTPSSLTLVAGRVARRAPGLAEGPQPLSSRAYEVTGEDAGMLRTLRRRARALRKQARDAARRFARRARAAARGITSEPTPPAPVRPIPVPAAPPAPDSLRPRHRVILAAIATLAVAIAAGIFADDRAPAGAAFLVFLGIVGATLGIAWGARRLLPDVKNESWLVRRLAVGGLAAAATFLIALPAWRGHTHHGGQTVLATCLALLIVDWTRRMSPDRASRVSLAHLIVAGIVAAVAAAMLEAADEVVIGILCGTCIAVQITSPWTPRVAMGRAELPLAPPGPAHPLSRETFEPVGTPAQAPAAPGRPVAAIPTVYTLARRSVAAGRHVVMWPIRLLLHLLTFVLTLGTFVLAALLALDLPGLLESGRIDPRIPRDMQRAFGVENWAFVLRSIGGVGLFVVACLALLLVMWVRRSRGTTHLLRGVVGTALLAAVPFVLARPGIDWHIPADTLKGGWAIWQDLVQSLAPASILRAALTVIGALVLLVWPAAPPRLTSEAEASPAAATATEPSI
jgi:hypothetical protein